MVVEYAGMHPDEVYPNQVGHGTNGEYTDIMKFPTLTLYVSAHDTTDDLIINAGNGNQWVDIELDFDQARRLIRTLQRAVERK